VYTRQIFEDVQIKDIVVFGLRSRVNESSPFFLSYGDGRWMGTGDRGKLNPQVIGMTR